MWQTSIEVNIVIVIILISFIWLLHRPKPSEKIT